MIRKNDKAYQRAKQKIEGLVSLLDSYPESAHHIEAQIDLLNLQIQNMNNEAKTKQESQCEIEGNSSSISEESKSHQNDANNSNENSYMTFNVGTEISH